MQISTVEDQLNGPDVSQPMDEPELSRRFKRCYAGRPGAQRLSDRTSKRPCELAESRPAVLT